MNSRERMAAAMAMQKPDRVPVMCQLALGHYFLNTDSAPHEIWFDSEVFARALVTLQRRYRFDGILVNLPGRPRDLLDQVASIERGPDGERLTWKNGEVTICPWDDNPYHMGAAGEPAPRAHFDAIDPDHLDSLDDFTGYTWGVYHVPWLSGRPDHGLLREIPPYFLRTLDLVRAIAGDDVAVHGEVFSPFTHFLELFGYERALLGTADRPCEGARPAGSFDRGVRGVGDRPGASRRGRGPYLLGFCGRLLPVPQHVRGIRDTFRAPGD